MTRQLAGWRESLSMGWPLIMALLLFIAPVYYEMSGSLWEEENYSHGPVILLVCLWLFWRELPRYLALQNEGRPIWGGLLSLIAALLYLVGRSQSLPLLELPSQIVMLLALILLFKGGAGVRVYWFALLFMLFLVPIPGLLLYSLTHVLKQQVSVVAETILFYLDYPIAREGVMLTIGQYQLLVADACSGMNSIIALSALGLLYLYLNPQPGWLRVGVILLLIIPIAVVANLIRVMALILITYYFGDEAGQGFVHSLAGILLFACSLTLIYLLDNILRLFSKLWGQKYA
ncbi:exosortase B [Aeromonas sp. QDB25]|uniref:exosortase B n=1 Tax=Aeromonas sp. QDB25 TaxID=2989832 RepID=UPI0022E39595|nr:exosortase B [Aeromonas sp. QDB25]